MEPMKAIGTIPVPLALTEVIPQLQSGGIDGVLAGMPILTAFKYYDSAKYVTDLNFAQIISVDVVNEAWFKAQPKDVQDAIRAAAATRSKRCSPGASRTSKSRTRSGWRTRARS
jgi:TRAP-type C4-dicarboxylate transport system substrate-binding protein